MSNKSPENRISGLHSLTPILYFSFFALLALSLSDPLLLLALLIVVGIGLSRANALSRWRTTLWCCLFMSLAIIVVNLIVSRGGQTIILRGPSLPGYGQILITREALIFSAVMALKLTLIISLFLLFGVLVSSGRMFRVFSRIAPRSTLLVVLTSLLRPRLMRRLRETHFVMQQRGLCSSSTGFLSTLRGYSPLLKLILLSALEDSWSISEALHSKAYGSGTRSRYIAERWCRSDTSVALIMGALCVLFAAYLLLPAGIEFYPVFRYSPLGFHLLFGWTLVAGLSGLLCWMLTTYRIEQHGPV